MLNHFLNFEIPKVGDILREGCNLIKIVDIKNDEYILIRWNKEHEELYYDKTSLKWLVNCQKLTQEEINSLKAQNL